MPLHIEILGEGPPLICLHGGMGLDHTLFLPWFVRLAEGRRIVLFDFSGNGRSTLNGGADRLSIQGWVQDVETVRKVLGVDRVAVLGHSFGGLIAQEYALTYPDRLSGLILSNTAPVIDFGDTIAANAQARGTPEQAELARSVLTSPAEDAAYMEDAFRLLLPLYFHEWHEKWGDELVSDIVYSADAFNVGNARVLPSFDSRDRLGTLTVPTLVLSSEDDWIMPRQQGGDRLTDAIDGARHVVFRESGHFPWVEETDRYVEAVSTFLNGLNS